MTVRIVPLPLSISNAYLLLGDRPVLVDAGKPGEEEKLLDLLHQHGIAPSDLSLVVLTHGHTDHAGSVNAVARAGVPIAIGADDAGLLERGVNEQLPVTGFPGRILQPIITRMTFAGASPQVLVRESLRLDAYGIGAAMVPVPGHTAGSCVVLLDNSDAVVGDLLRGGFAFARIRPHRPVRHFFAEDVTGVRRGVDLVLEHDHTICTSVTVGRMCMRRTSAVASIRSPRPTNPQVHRKRRRRRCFHCAAPARQDLISLSAWLPAPDRR